MGTRMERHASSFLDAASSAVDSAADDIDITVEVIQARIDKMREQFDNMQEQLVEHYESFTDTTTSKKSPHTPSFTIKEEDNVIRITLTIGNIETDMIENHLEDNTLVITLPKDKPSLRITIHPDTLVIAGEKRIEKEETTDDDSTTSSYAVSSRSIYLEKPLPATVVTTQDINIVHSADDKTLTIELPKKVHKQQFSIKKK